MSRLHADRKLNTHSIHEHGINHLDMTWLLFQHRVPRNQLHSVLQVALKRQQAAEDAIALGLTAVATGTQYGYLPPGPIFGMAITAPKSQEAGEQAYAAPELRTGQGDVVDTNMSVLSLFQTLCSPRLKHYEHKLKLFHNWLVKTEH